jgi:hypothetical protein
VKSITVEASEPREIDELRKLREELPDGSARRSRVEDEIFEQLAPQSKPF